ncbi:MAG: TIGR03545 family protein [Gemmatimonadaceae bacterium]|nr:TIGR03545 family protein [Gemmatimonadaceae bacterium]
MSTAGSAPSNALEARPARRRRGVVRWRGLIPIVVVLLAIVVGWLTMGEALLRNTIEEGATKFLGTEVDIASLHVRLRDATVELQGVSIADPFDRMRNLVEAQRVTAVLEGRPLLEKKIIVRTLTLAGVNTGTARRTAAAPAPRDGFAASTLRSLDTWAARLRKPIASFTPIDTIRAVVLDPTKLASVQRALEAGARADSLRDALAAGYRALALQTVHDSARAVTTRLSGANPRTLGIDGTRKAVADVRRTLAQVDSAKRRVEALARDARTTTVVLGAELQALDSARREDYAFARSLMKIPTIEGPDLGGALFGDVSIDRFQKIMYWAQMAQKYVPPGLLPREQPGPKRLRMAGSTIAFPKAREYPDFLLRRGDVDLGIGGKSAASGKYVASVTNVTTMPALVREPMRFTLSRRSTAGVVAAIDAAGVLDHVGGRIRDSLGVDASGVTLPSFPLPGLPMRATLGEGTSRIDLLRVGDRVAARWTIHAPGVTWRRTDSIATGGVKNTMQSLALRVIEGVNDLEIVADLTGEIAKPSLAVRSNLDRLLAERMRAVAGEEIAKAEAKARAQVDRIVEEKTAPLRAKADSLRAQGEQLVADARARLDEEKKKLDERLKALLPTGGLIKLPGEE